MNAITRRLRRLEERHRPEVSDVVAVGAKERLLEKIARMAERSAEDSGPAPTVESVKQRLAEWVRASRERRDPQ